MKRIPMPKTGNWKEYYGSWDNFVKAVHRSIGRKIGSGVIVTPGTWDKPAETNPAQREEGER
jgi:hypothetical protein